MGFFSFKTADTQEPIRKMHTGEHRTVFLLQPNSKPPIAEDAYEGYGDFGGIDYYQWLYDANAESLNLPKNISGDNKRKAAIDLHYDEEVQLTHPLKFSFNPDAVYESLPASLDDPDQGFF